MLLNHMLLYVKRTFGDSGRARRGCRRELHNLPVRVRCMRRLRPEEGANVLPCEQRSHYCYIAATCKSRL